MYNDFHLTCSCCGNGLLNTEEQNAHFGIVPYPNDEGFGMCLECGGDPKAASLRKKMGWAKVSFFDARVEILQEKMNPDNAVKFEAMSYAKKCVLITRLIERGSMI